MSQNFINSIQFNSILAVCNFSLNNKRFNWRHDNVLRVIVKALLDRIGKINREEIERPERNWTCFRSSKGTYRKLDNKIRKDEDECTAQFPQHIYCTAERPDIVVWSEES